MRKMRRFSAGSGHTGTWVISFADLMSLLMAFFVMLLSFSVQDQEKLNMAAGSVQNAFGIEPFSAMTGMIERTGNPERDYPRELAPTPTRAATEFATKDRPQYENQGQEANTWTDARTDAERQKAFALAAASLKQAWQDQPDITGIADQIAIEDTKDGLNIVLHDRSGKPMFPEGSKYPFEATRKALAAMAPSLARMPNRIRVTGHTAAGGTFSDPAYGPWELSFDRADVTRNILQEFGVSNDRIESVSGSSDTDPLFPNDPYLSANQRISILLLYEAPPVPVNLQP